MVRYMEELIIEKLRLDDLNTVLSFYSNIIPVKQDYDACLNKYKKIMYDDNYNILVAKINDTVVGTLTGIICDSIGFGGYDFMVLDYLYVDEKYRNAGIATILFEALEKIAKQQNCGYIIFVSSKTCTAAHKLYKKLGYTKDGIGFRKVLVDYE